METRARAQKQLGLEQFFSAAPAAEEAETTSSRGSLSDKAKAAFVQKCNKYYMEFMNKNPTIVFSPGNSGTRRKDFKTFLREWAGTAFPVREGVCSSRYSARQGIV